MIDAIKKWLDGSNLFKKLAIDFQSEKAETYSINSLPCNRLLRKDIEGNRKMQYPVQITSRVYTATDLDRIANLNFLDDVVSWIDEQNERENYPIFGDNVIVERCEVTNYAYLLNNNEQTQSGVYQIQIKFYYKEEMKNGKD